MKLYRVGALIERDMRKFFRSPALMMASMIFPLVQLIVLGYAFGGKIKGANIALVDEDHSVEARKVHEMFDGIAEGPQTFKVVDYDSLPRAIDDLRAGFVRGVVDIPPDFSRRYFQHDRPRIAFTEDNTDQQMSAAVLERIQELVQEMNTSGRAASACGPGGIRHRGSVPVRRVRQVFAGRLDGDGGVYRRDGGRRDHIHRR